MSLFESFTFRWLRWRRPTAPPYALPPGIERYFVDTPGGKLEMLYAPRNLPPPPPPPPLSSSPPPSSSPSPPSSGDGTSEETPGPFLYFVHGGMGGAWVWLEYMQYLAGRGIPCYAVSLRGHGASYYPSFPRMVYATTMRMLADDVLAGLRWVQREHEGGRGREAVLVGHSSGGGLCQLLLSEKLVTARGLVLVASLPGFEPGRVSESWRMLDPWFVPRMILHLWHPNSPLSHPALTRRAFFSREQTDPYLEAFQDKMCAYESLASTVGMMKSFVNQRTVLSQLAGRSTGQGVMILCGELDRIMRQPIMEDLVRTYRTTYSNMVQKKQLLGEDAEVVPLTGEGGRDNAGHGVRYCLVPRAAHHLMNDVTWEVGAEKVLAFYEQL
ncbi:hypothetical protein VTH06DRAFT_5012 [Thermothelomyces fergusii]